MTSFDASTKNLGNFGWAWTIIGNPAGTDWLQSGYFRSWGDAEEYNFAQLNSGGTVTDHVGATVAPGETHQYWQQYHPDTQGIFHSMLIQRACLTPSLISKRVGVEFRFSSSMKRDM